MGNGFEINGTSGMFGRLALSGGQPDGQELLIVQDICTQLGIALEREMLVADREKFVWLWNGSSSAAHFCVPWLMTCEVLLQLFPGREICLRTSDALRCRAQKACR